MNIATRAKNIVLQPQEEWPVTAGEAASTGSLYRGYVLPLAAIGPVASFLGMSVVGFGPFRTSLPYGLGATAVAYVMALCSVFVIALAIDGLAPSFQGSKDGRRALQVAVYSLTPSWLGGMLLLFPPLGLLALVAALYGIYLLYLGLPVLMQSPRSRAMPYAASVVGIAIVAQLAFGAASAAILGVAGLQPGAASPVMSVAPELSPAEQESLRTLGEIAKRMQADRETRRQDADQDN